MEFLVSEIHDDYVKYYSNRFASTFSIAFIENHQMAIMLLSYASLCYWGFSLAKQNAKPIVQEGKWILRVYNIFQVIFSGYIAYLAASTYLLTLVKTGDMCQRMDLDTEKGTSLIVECP